MRDGEWLDMNRLKQFLPVVIFLWVIAYFAYHAMTGEQGMRNLIVYQQREAALSQELAQLQRCRTSYENRIALLSDQNLDLDYLEERAHAVLFMADPRDIVLAVNTKTNTNTITPSSLPCAN